MKEIVSIKTKKRQIVSDDVWNKIVALGWAGRFEMKPMLERKLTEPKTIRPPEILTKTKPRGKEQLFEIKTYLSHQLWTKKLTRKRLRDLFGRPLK